MDNSMRIYLMCVNLLAFILFGIDKEKARRHAWRIPESTLILAAVCGGGPGAWLGMRVFHHKTRKPLFHFGIPFITLLEAGVLLYKIGIGQ